MHPLEQLRYVARGWESMDDLPVTEVAEVLVPLAEESPATLLHACRRLIEYFPASGRLWWLSARALAAPDPVEGIWEAADELFEDPTGKRLAEALPAGAGVSVLGPVAAAVAGTLRRRRAEERTGRKKGREPAMLLVSALAAGPDGLLVQAGAAWQLADLVERGRTVWAVVPRGTVLPGALWEQALSRARSAGGVDKVNPEGFSALAGPDGLSGPRELLSSPTCPAVAELLGWRS